METMGPLKEIKAVPGMDTLRLIAACTVALGHGIFPDLYKLFGSPGSSVELVIFGLVRNLFNGSFAVSVFFIISGFCIHYPNVDRQYINRGTFIIRRLVRIGVPLIFVKLATAYFGEEYSLALDAVLWSVYCEIAYYIIYPFVLPKYKMHLKSAMIVTSVSSVIIMIIYNDLGRVWSFGYLTPLVCVPLWIFGAICAEDFRNNVVRNILPGSIWIWRLSLFFAGMIAIMFEYHSPIKISQPWTVLLFTPLACCWFYSELSNVDKLGSIKILEAGGRASYSIYLVHMFVITFFVHIGVSIPNAILALGPLFALVLISWLFYRLIEFPSHRLAKRLGRSAALGNK